MKINERVKNFENISILYVEDDNLTRKNISSILQKIIPKSYSASNGEEGLKLFKENSNINVVITDLHMPFMSGIEMIQEIKKLNKDMLFIITSSFISEFKSSDKNICDTLEKPISTKTLFNALDKCVEKL